tara:strand:+ start:252 stop:743 length:492 start_codon:yes stop_codon:yes gene_type:complete
MNSVNTTGQYIVFGLTNWVDLKCPNDYICIDYCYIGDDMSGSYLKKYSMPYNNPKLKFAILCDSEKDAEWLNDIICEELEEYDLEDELYGDNWKKPFDNKCLENIYVIEEEEIKILVDNELEIFEKNIKKRFKDYQIKKNKDLDNELRIRKLKNNKNNKNIKK